MNKILAAIVSSLLASPAFSFTCFLTVVKDSCWTNYDVSITAYDTSNDYKLANVVIPQGKSWARQQFLCEPNQVIKYAAAFEPPFWAADKGKKFGSKGFTTLPRAPSKGMTAWNITICYAENFASVPLPPDAKGGCACDASNIPAPIGPKVSNF